MKDLSTPEYYDQAGVLKPLGNSAYACSRIDDDQVGATVAIDYSKISLNGSIPKVGDLLIGSDGKIAKLKEGFPSGIRFAEAELLAGGLADKAINDSDGNKISTTYAKLSELSKYGKLSAQQTWSDIQHFTQGFDALNGNFKFSDTTNIGMELGRTDGTPGTPYIDFHTDGKSGTDYNSRILATGNQLQITASGGLSLNGKDVLVNQIEELSYTLNTEYFEDTSTSGGAGKQSGIWKISGTDIFIINANLQVKKAITKDTGSVWVFREFNAYGRKSFQSIWKRSTHYVIAGSRINHGGNAFWLDPFDDMPTVNNTTIQATLVFYGYQM